MSLVALIDYGSGNLRSAEKALARAAEEHGTRHTIAVTADPAVAAKAERIVLPGVGAFADCMAGLKALPGMIEALSEAVLVRGIPFLGICVGMQLLAEVGREFGDHPGLGWIKGDVVRMAPSNPALKIPHMGWNELSFVRPHPLFAGLEPGHTPISCIPISSVRPTRPRSWRPPITAGRSRLPSDAPTSWARNFIPRRARPPALPSSATS